MIYMLLSNNPSPGDINLSNLPCLDLPLLQSIVSGWSHDGDPADMLMAPSLVI